MDVSVVQQQMLVDLTRDALMDLNAEQRIHREKVNLVLRDMVSDIETLLISLGLTNSQEDALLNTINHSIKETMAVFEQGDRIEVRLEQVITKLKGG